MKKLYSLLFLSFATAAIAQIPNGYYNSATGTGYTLKTQLENIIDNHNDQGYSGLYITYQSSDKDFYYEGNGTLLDMYTENPGGPECEFTYGINQDNGSGGTAECEKYNREHIVPQSVFNSQTPMYSDAHFVVPSDKFVNAQRGNLPFGRVGTPNYTSTNGSKRGSNLNSGYSAGYTGIVFEPIDEFKGDIARMLFYFATRYQDQVASWPYEMFNGTSNQVFTNTSLNILLTWHQNDPVSQREIDRNNAVHDRQNNRNPFIDHPEYVCQIYTAQCAALGTNDVTDAGKISVYPNPATNGKISVFSASELVQFQLININGQIIREINNPTSENNTYTIENLPAGFYLLRVNSAEDETVKKVIVN